MREDHRSGTAGADGAREVNDDPQAVSPSTSSEIKSVAPPPDPAEIAKQAREHAWNWFALHATQRMQAFNFFMVATAFLMAAYASVLEKHPVVAAVVAAVGAWLAFLFNRLDARSSQLVHTGEDALKASQAHLASLTSNAQLKILDVVERPAASPDDSFVRRRWFALKWSMSSYGGVINWVQWTIVALFLFGVAYAACLAIRPLQPAPIE